MVIANSIKINPIYHCFVPEIVTVFKTRSNRYNKTGKPVNMKNGGINNNNMIR